MADTHDGKAEVPVEEPRPTSNGHEHQPQSLPEILVQAHEGHHQAAPHTQHPHQIHPEHGVAQPPHFGQDGTWYNGAPQACGPPYGSFYEGPAYSNPPPVMAAEALGRRPPSSQQGGAPTVAPPQDIAQDLPWAKLNKSKSKKENGGLL